MREGRPARVAPSDVRGAATPDMRLGDRSSGLLPYAIGIGALVALAGGFGMLAFAGLNLAHAVGGNAESPELNVAFGVLFGVAALALLCVAAIAGWWAWRLLRASGA